MNATRREWLGTTAVAGLAASPGNESILSVFAKRQTVRKYKSDPVPDEHVRVIIDAARRAPTCMNQQPWKFLVVRKPETIAKLRTRTLDLLAKRIDESFAKTPAMSESDRDSRRKQAVSMTEGYFTAPVYVVVLVDTECPCSGYLKHDGPLAAGYLLLAARALGYGTVYLTDGIPEEVSREVLNIPARYQRVCMTPIGVPDGWPEPKPKKKLEEFIAYETI